jgi:hypothetical protein
VNDFRMNKSLPIRNGDPTISTGGGTYTRQDSDVVPLASGDDLTVVQTLQYKYVGGSWPAIVPAISGSDTASRTAAPTSIYYSSPGPNLRHVLTGVSFGYGTTPSGVGSFVVQAPSGTTIYSVPVTSAGAAFMDFPAPGLVTGYNTDMYLILASGGPGVTGTIAVKGRQID